MFTSDKARSLTEAVRRDHLALDGFYQQIIQASDPGAQGRFRNIFTWELSRHSAGDELVLFPAFEKHLGNGRSFARRDRDEHQVVSIINTKFMSFICITCCALG